MGRIRRQGYVKLIIGFIFKKEEAFNKVKIILTKKFGAIDFESRIITFNHTDYYERELGKRLKRSFISFRDLIPPEDLPKIKITTNKMEKRLAKGQSRLVNIDPGYLDLAKVILASSKDYRHRIYLNSGIYAEVTLYFQIKSYKPWIWTFPDYKTNEYIDIFNRIRKIYAQEIKSK